MFPPNTRLGRHLLATHVVSYDRYKRDLHTTTATGGWGIKGRNGSHTHLQVPSSPTFFTFTFFLCGLLTPPRTHRYRSTRARVGKRNHDATKAPDATICQRYGRVGRPHDPCSSQYKLVRSRSRVPWCMSTRAY